MPYSAIIWEAASRSRWKWIQDPQPDLKKRNLGTHSSKWDISINSLPSELRESRRGGGKSKRQRVWSTLEITASTSYELTETETACTGLHIYYSFQFSVYFYGTFECVSDSCDFSWTLSVGLPCPSSMWWVLFYLIFYFVMLWSYLLEASLFLMRAVREWIPMGQDMGRNWEKKSEGKL